VISNEDGTEVTETSPLLPRHRQSLRKPAYDAEANEEDGDDDDDGYQPGTWNRLGHHYPSLRAARKKLRRASIDPRQWDFRELGRKIIIEPACMVPAVFLGLLLNLLDALSYGIILFPLGEEVFKDLGPDGVSMFYVSCIISQLVYSTGSIFRGGVGSEMIEVVPFFHKMAYLIMAKMGTANPDALRATVITSYAMSSIITGFVFLGLGAARLGTLVNFFPHSILTGCIGGVGIFLFVTGIEVSARLDGNLELSKTVLAKLFEADTVVLWIPPLALAIILLTIKHFYDRPWLVPAYYIGITALFYIITTAVPSINMEDLRSHGWVFQAPASGVPFYNFYSYYKFTLVDWKAIWATVPSQLALTFFGILHVPINVPNLAMVVQEDNVSINRELIMHGISNTLSGCVGSIQNYLVFANSVLFINTGADSRLAGYMLAAATFGLWVAGPVVIGFVPVMVVGTLIYQLGIDLAQEALVSTYGRLHRLEYCTIIIIAFVMGLYDFVVGIAIGIGLACLVYVVQTSRKNVIRAEFSGAVAESTVRRHPRARKYLHKVGPQIRVVKLSSYLFFGSIVRVEKNVRSMVDAEAFAASPVRYLILDFSHVSGIDFSAAEAFARMNRILHRREVKMSMAGVTLGSEVGKSLSMVGLFVEGADDPSVPAPKLYEDLNGALEACENEMLMVLAGKEKIESQDGNTSPTVRIPENSPDLPITQFDGLVGSPRRDLLYQAATTTITETSAPEQRRWQNFRQPLPLLLQAFSELTSQNESFWFRAVPYFVKRQFVKGQLLYARGDQPDGFYLLESGILRAEYYLEQGNYHESIVAGTTCGELPFFSETERTCSVIAEQECVAWLLTPEKWEELQEKDGDVARELLKVGMKLSAERMNAITTYVLITAS
jgi:SulP family sulfate permease